MRLRRSKSTPEPLPADAPPTAETAVQPPTTAPQASAPGTQPGATSGPGPVGEPNPDQGPRPPITGAHPVARPPAVASDAEGQRAWVAQLDRKVGTRTYAGAAALVLALAASIVAIVLAIDARDNSAGIDDLARVESQLSATVTSEAEAGVTALQEVNELSSRLSTLEDRVDEIATTGDTAVQRVTVVEDDIDDLRQQISALDGATNDPTAGTADTTP